MNKVRTAQIKQLQTNIKRMKKKKKMLDMKDLIKFTMSQFDVSRRTAKEYIDVALFNMEIEL